MTLSGPVIQVAWVTDDLAATQAVLGAQLGVRAWTRLEGIVFEPGTCTYRGQPADFVADISLGYSGDLQLELIRPVRGQSLYSEHLERHGPGLHHTCVEVTDMRAALAKAAAAGLEVVQAGSMAGGGMEFAYLDATGAGASYLELARIGPELKAFFTALRDG